MTASHQDSIVVLQLHGDVDVATAGAFAELLDERIRDGERRFAIDLGDVTIIDASGLAVLVRCLRTLHQADGDLVFVAPRPTVRRVLSITGLDEVFAVQETIDDALAELKSRV